MCIRDRGYRAHYLRDHTFNRFDTIPETDNRHTHDDGIHRVSIASHGNKMLREHWVENMADICRINMQVKVRDATTGKIQERY